MGWFERHRAAIEAQLAPGETLHAADRVRILGARRRVPRGLPGPAFILAVTDVRIVALRASLWLARPRELADAWAYVEGATLVAGSRFGRVRLVLPDRSVVTLGPYGGRSVRHLVRPR